MKTNLSSHGLKALEITMRDVLDGLDDAASYMNFRSVPDTVEILSIEAPYKQTQSQHKIKPLSSSLDQCHTLSDYKRSSNIVDYLIQRELKKSA